MADGAQRRPKDVYNDHKGFTGRVLQKMSGTAPQPALNLHAVAAHPEKASPADLRELRDAIQRRQLVEDVMELKGAFFPGLDAIKKANETHDNSVTLNERVQEMQKRHIQDVRTLYQWQAQDYYDEMLDLAQSKPDIGDPGAEAFYKDARTNYALADSFDDNLDRLNLAHISSITPLLREKNMHKQREDAVQRRRDQQFPTTIADFRMIRNKDVQIRIARFLEADDTVRERMQDEFKWVWRQVMPLISEYARTDSFKAEIKTLLRDIEVPDPRKARRAPQPTVMAS
ncbi:uncharacterized protein TRAVEDRAFT_148391 [Trametes versicolor FP-101664 SS1]|uniref:uncharacterized protein n=1 Tax=Trametes versicolor (strain FP-101664) TaxID=717944 RepID=UPI000462164C|nr:uncharacterized protein TRAVEDRAFT_148391 [Trametes versicolor FP-101664 SS1]EIW58296.1 hypothetical protein TRAVEDRAFT_148391 [Trametes versicolor FP-101664 SS1]